MPEFPEFPDPEFPELPDDGGYACPGIIHCFLRHIPSVAHQSGQTSLEQNLVWSLGQVIDPPENDFVVSPTAQVTLTPLIVTTIPAFVHVVTKHPELDPLPKL